MVLVVLVFVVGFVVFVVCFVVAVVHFAVAWGFIVVGLVVVVGGLLLLMLLLLFVLLLVLLLLLLLVLLLVNEYFGGEGRRLTRLEGGGATVVVDAGDGGRWREVGISSSVRTTQYERLGVVLVVVGERGESKCTSTLKGFEEVKEVEAGGVAEVVMSEMRD